MYHDEEPQYLADIVYKHFGVAGAIIFWIIVFLVAGACAVLAMMAWF